MSNLRIDFEADAAETGFRLQRLEILNWGTFNRVVWAIEPGGHTALLTGANGSGKSTLVDALLTLLVPYGKRSYNQASGAERRRERDERTYMLGAYGKVKTEESYTARTQFLRTRDDFSVLLAVFANATYGQELTLAQVFWIEDDGVKKFFALAQRALSIQRHFSDFGKIAELKKRLRGANVEVYDEFVRYSRQFCKIVGLRSDKALDLFNQTVSIKEIGGLNQFVRDHMLERSDAQEKIAQLRTNYDNLTRAHAAILKAERQLALLRPLVAEADQYDAQEQKLRELRAAEDAVPAFFAQRRIELIDQARTITDAALARAAEQRDALDAQLAALRQREYELKSAIDRDEVGEQLRNIEKDIAHLEALMEPKRREERRYSELARKLNRPAYAGEAEFDSNRVDVQAALGPLEAQHIRLGEQRDEQKLRQNQLQTACAEIASELASLRGRKSQIPERDLQVRAGLLQALELDEGQAPFVGELLKVRDNERAWEGAIERLLNGFGRQLLVTEPLYARVSAYVNSTDLRGRIVFHRVDERRAPSARTLEADALPHKLEIKPGTAFQQWLHAELHDAYNYTCCDTLEQFRHEHRAITREGLIKSGGARHEKDDRRSIGDRKFFVLGWDNRDKIREYEAEQRRQQAALTEVDQQIKRLDEQRKLRQEQLGWLKELLAFDRFGAIDWQRDARQIAALREQQRQLEQSSDRLRQLRADLAALQAELAETQREREAAGSAATNHRRDLDEYARQRADAETRLSIFPADEVARYAPLVAARVKARELTLGNIRDAEDETRTSFRSAFSGEQGRLNSLRDSLVRRMLDYKNAFTSDTNDVDAAIDALNEFRRMLATIERDDLPRYAERFKRLLDEKVVADIVIFKSALEKQEEEIRDNIRNLNQSLRTIDYTQSTYIQLNHDPSRDAEVREFKVALTACLPDVGQRSSAETNEASFQKIRSLIERFEHDERWTTKVTDVRFWLDFSASERYKEDGSEKNYFSDSSGKSGGQKAKLAYTILASAIAFQFGLDTDGARANSFRFVVVDEAFSKSDETNARYAMELFKQLHLQLLVVTPLDKTHVVEPYIAACHFVTNSDEENDSRVYNLTIAQYHERKAVVQASTAP